MTTTTLRLHEVGAEGQDPGLPNLAELELRPYEEIVDIQSALVGGYAVFRVTTIEVAPTARSPRRR